MVSTAITYGVLQVTPFHDEKHRLVALVLRQTQIWDGTETVAVFPATLAEHNHVYGWLQGHSVRIKSAVAVFDTNNVPLIYNGSIGTLSSTLNFQGPTFLSSPETRIDMGLPDGTVAFNWEQATATNAFMALGAVSAPANLQETAISVFLEVVL